MWPDLIPRVFGAWQERRRAMAELNKLQQEEEWALERDEMNPIHRAVRALANNDRSGAIRFWQSALERCPRLAKRSHDSVEILLQLERFDEAETLVKEGLKREPRSSFYAAGFARVADQRGDLEEALRRWNSVRRKFPTEPMGFVRGAACLRKAGQIQAAEDLHTKSLELFPNHLLAWLEWARTAEQRGDWPEAMRRWEAVCDKFQHNAGYVGIARALEELGQFEEAERLLEETKTRFPLVVEIAVARPRLAYKRGDKEAALAHWADIRRRFPLDRFGYEGGARLLSEMGRHAEADDVLAAAVKRFPDVEWPAVEYAMAAHTRKDWAAAVPRWEAAVAQWPNRQDARGRMAEALTALGR